LLDAADQAVLFHLARRSIHARLDRRAAPSPEGGSDALDAVRGLFVTLRRAAELRGCIGHAVGRLPLREAVIDLAQAAAFHDRRFPPVTRVELPRLDLELSVMTPLAPIAPEEVEVGRHGLLIRSGERSGLLLPQVATDRGWDAETFLRATCRKARLPEGTWSDPAAELLGFAADVYAEGEGARS